MGGRARGAGPRCVQEVVGCRASSVRCAARSSHQASTSAVQGSEAIKLSMRLQMSKSLHTVMGVQRENKAALEKLQKISGLGVNESHCCGRQDRAKTSAEIMSGPLPPLARNESSGASCTCMCIRCTRAGSKSTLRSSPHLFEQRCDGLVPGGGFLRVEKVGLRPVVVLLREPGVGTTVEGLAGSAVDLERQSAVVCRLGGVQTPDTNVSNRGIYGGGRVLAP